MEIKKIIIEHNDGDFTRKGEGDILLANLRLRGGPGIVTHFDVPCLKELVGLIPERLEIYVKKPVDLESDRERNLWEQGVNLIKMNLGEKTTWEQHLEKGMKGGIQMCILDLDSRVNSEDVKKFYQLLGKYRDEIKTHDENWCAAFEKKQQELSQVEMLHLDLNEVSDILKKYPDVEDQELMEAVIKKVIDEQLPLEEQSYGEKAIKEQLEIEKEKVEEKSQKTRKHRR